MITVHLCREHADLGSFTGRTQLSSERCSLCNRPCDGAVYIVRDTTFVEFFGLASVVQAQLTKSLRETTAHLRLRLKQLAVFKGFSELWQGNGLVEGLAFAVNQAWKELVPEDMVLHCPGCGKQHLDIGEFQARVHRTHLCENTPDGPGTGCGHLWKPCEYATRGVLEVVKPEDS